MRIARILQPAGRLTAFRKGVADEELAKKEAERGRKRTVDEINDPNCLRELSRSASSFSSTSVSTISTNRSRSPTPRRTNRHDAGGHREARKHGQALYSQDAVNNRRRSSSMSTTSDTSESSIERRRNRRPRDVDRHMRSSANPDARRRERDLHERTSNHSRSNARKRRRSSSSSSLSCTSDSSPERSRRDMFKKEPRNTRRRRSSISPEHRGRDRKYDGRANRRTKSRSDSMDRSQVARNRQSMTPGVSNRKRNDTRSQDHRPLRDLDRRLSNSDDRYGSSFRDENLDGSRRTRPPQQPPSRKERSLSPFSKRLALTQAMNVGR